MKWESISIEEIKLNSKNALVGGPFGSDLSGIHYVDFGVPVIRGTNLPFDSTFNNADFVFVSEEKANKLSANTAFPGDLIFTQRGTLGQVGIVPCGEFDKYIISQSQMKLTVDITKANPLFVYYYFRTKECLKRIENLAFSSGVPHINLGILRKFKIPYPPITIQNKIATLLSVYDDLIENNKQRIKLLEEMAGEIYKEWFVRLRFPGYENTRYFNNEGKEVTSGTADAWPERWEKGEIGDMVKFYKGKNITENTIVEGAVPVVAGGISPAYFHNVSNTHSPTITVSASGANAGYVNLFYTNIWASDCSYIDTKATKHIFYFYLLFKNRQQEVSFLQKGSAQPHVYPKDLMSLKTIKPDIGVLDNFEKLIKPFFEEIEILSNKNLLLQQTRDLLLPRLISGKLSVEHMVDQNPDMKAVAH